MLCLGVKSRITRQPSLRRNWFNNLLVIDYWGLTVGHNISGLVGKSLWLWDKYTTLAPSTVGVPGFALLMPGGTDSSRFIKGRDSLWNSEDSGWQRIKISFKGRAWEGRIELDQVEGREKNGWITTSLKLRKKLNKS